jgi:hypothetical protein
MENTKGFFEDMESPAYVPVTYPEPWFAVPAFRDRNARTVKDLIRLGSAGSHDNGVACAAMAGLIAKILVHDCEAAQLESDWMRLNGKRFTGVSYSEVYLRDGREVARA